MKFRNRFLVAGAMREESNRFCSRMPFQIEEHVRILANEDTRRGDSLGVKMSLPAIHREPDQGRKHEKKPAK